MNAGSDEATAGPSSDAARLAQEEVVLQRAAELRRNREFARLALPKEPDRNFTHWDQLLQEMKWMADDFARWVGFQTLGLSCASP